MAEHVLIEGQAKYHSLSPSKALLALLDGHVLNRDTMNKRKDSHVVDFEFGVLGWHQFEVVYNYTPPGADGSAPSVEILDVVGSPLRGLLGWEDFDNVLVAEVLKHESEEAARDPGYWDGSPLRMSNRPRGGGDPNAIYMDDPKSDRLNLPKKPKP